MSFHFIKFLFFSLLFHKLKTSNLFDFAFKNLRILNGIIFKNQIEPILSLNDDKIEDFGLITGSDDLIISRLEYEEVISSLNEFKIQIFLVLKSNTKKFQVIQLIEKWRDDPINKFALPCWKEHFHLLTKIFQERGKHFYIPNSIVKEYLNFIIEKVILPIKNSLKFNEIIDLIISLITLMMKNAGNTNFIDLILKEVHMDFNPNQIISLFNSFHEFLPRFSKSLNEIVGKEKQKAFLRVLKIYLTIFNYFHNFKIEIFALKRFHKVPPMFESFFDLLPIYQVLISETPDILNSIIINPNLATTECLGMFNFFLKETEFNNVFSSSIPRVLNKIQIFSYIKEILFNSNSLFYILNYSLDKGLIYIFEFLLNFTNDDDTILFDTCCALIQKFMTNKKYSISLYAAVLAVCPKITIAILDDLLMKLLSENKYRKDLNLDDIRGFRRIIAAAENIYNHSTTWEMSDGLIKILESDPSFDPKNHYFFQAARVYLYRKFGIPFTCTNFIGDTYEEVDWIEVIGFVNFFLERERAKHKMNQAGIHEISSIL